jgi:hypothetical protein
MVEIDKLLRVVGVSSLFVVHQWTACSDRSSNKIRRTQICQNSPMVRTSRTNTDSPAWNIIGERGEGDGAQKGERVGYLKAFREERGDL